MATAQKEVRTQLETQGGVEFKVAATKAEREAIFKLRYEIYVEEMHRDQPFANHAERKIEEPADKTAIILGAWDGEELIGTIRMNISSDSKFEFPELYDFAKFEAAHPGRVGLVTKLMIKKERRGGRICLNIFKETFKVLRTEGAEVILIDANDHLIPIYRRIGFKAIKEKCAHPLYGMVTPMVMDLKNQEYFNEISSPLADLCRFYNGMERLSSIEDTKTYAFQRFSPYMNLAESMA